MKTKEVFSVKGPHGPLEHVHVCAGNGRFSMKSIFKIGFLGKIRLWNGIKQEKTRSKLFQNYFKIQNKQFKFSNFRVNYGCNEQSVISSNDLQWKNSFRKIISCSSHVNNQSWILNLPIWFQNCLCLFFSKR